MSRALSRALEAIDVRESIAILVELGGIESCPTRPVNSQVSSEYRDRCYH